MARLDDKTRNEVLACINLIELALTQFKMAKAFGLDTKAGATSVAAAATNLRAMIAIIEKQLTPAERKRVEVLLKRHPRIKPSVTMVQGKSET